MDKVFDIVLIIILALQVLHEVRTAAVHDCNADAHDATEDKTRYYGDEEDERRLANGWRVCDDLRHLLAVVFRRAYQFCHADK